jgi:sialidase-1
MAPEAEILSKQIICKEPGRYIGWPTIIRTRAGELIIVFSGDRDSHICPWGKTEMVRSSDEGKTWSDPVVIRNTPLDDRDAGLVETSDGTLISTWFTAVYFGDNSSYKAHVETLSQAVRERWMGHWTQRSTDSGVTWEEPVRSVGSTPHGPIVNDEGNLLFLGSGTFDGTHGLTVEESTDHGRSWHIIGTVPQPEGIGLGEPYMVETKSGKLVGMFRYGTSNLAEKFMYQAESNDGGRTWTVPVKTTILGYPAHMIRLPDDRILLVYGVRVPPFGERARVSIDEGETWSDEIVLCTDTSPDLGYPASAQLGDGSILTVYYQIDKPGEPTCLMGTHWRLGAGG